MFATPVTPETASKIVQVIVGAGGVVDRSTINVVNWIVYDMRRLDYLVDHYPNRSHIDKYDLIRAMIELLFEVSYIPKDILSLPQLYESLDMILGTRVAQHGIASGGMYESRLS